MQTKRYETAESFTLGTGGQLNEEIANDDNLKVNWHGIRFKGRIMADQVSADNAAAGMIGIMCVPQEGIATPAVSGEADLNNFYSYIIANEPWRVFGGSSTQGFTAIYDFDIVLKSTRTCPKGGRLIGYVSNRGNKNVIVNSSLSTFETATANR